MTDGKDGNSRRPLTAFMVFAGSMREKMLEENPTGTPVDLGRQLVLRWQRLPEESKKVYYEISKADNEAFWKIKTGNSTDKEASMKSSIASSDGKTPLTRKIQAPKPAMSAYMFYSKAARKRFRQLNPRASFGELGKLIGIGWRNLSVMDKAPFEELARQDKERQRHQKAIYLKEVARLRSLERKEENAAKKRAKVDRGVPPTIPEMGGGNVSMEFQSLDLLTEREMDNIVSGDFLGIGGLEDRFSPASSNGRGSRASNGVSTRDFVTSLGAVMGHGSPRRIGGVASQFVPRDLGRASSSGGSPQFKLRDLGLPRSSPSTANGRKRPTFTPRELPPVNMVVRTAGNNGAHMRNNSPFPNPLPIPALREVGNEPPPKMSSTPSSTTSSPIQGGTHKVDLAVPDKVSTATTATSVIDVEAATKGKPSEVETTTKGETKDISALLTASSSPVSRPISVE